MKRPEQRLQTEIAGYLRGHLAPPAFFSAIGHGSRGGGSAGWLRGVIAKQMGVVSGLPDLYFRRPLEGTQGALTPWLTGWIELKAGNRPVPDYQAAVHETMRSWGDRVAVARSLDETKAILTGWGFVLTEKQTNTIRITRALAADLRAVGLPAPSASPASAAARPRGER